ENVAIDPESRRLDLDDDRLTENTRAAYPISFIGNAVLSGQGGHPRNIVMLTADAFGVLPPISRLSAAGAMYHFLSGYTAKVAGKEKGGAGAEGDVQHLLRCAVPAAGAERLRRDARRADRSASGASVAREHGMDGRPLRNWDAHENPVHARDDPRGARRCA